MPILDRRGNPIKRKQRQRVLLDICAACNTELDRRFEKPAKGVVEALALGGWAGSHDETDWRAVGMWWAKVLLLLGHADARLNDRRLNELARMDFDDPLPDYRWMTDNSPAPSGLSVFAFNADTRTVHEEFSLVVPAVVNMDDGSSRHCHVLSLATPGLCITVVSHPGIVIDHPMVRAGEAWELLHNPPRRGDLSQLPEHSHRYVRMMLRGRRPRRTRGRRDGGLQLQSAHWN